MRPTEFKPGQLWRTNKGNAYLVVSMDNQLTFIHSMTDVRVSLGTPKPSHVHEFVGEFVGFHFRKTDVIDS